MSWWWRSLGLAMLMLLAACGGSGVESAGDAAESVEPEGEQIASEQVENEEAEPTPPPTTTAAPDPTTAPEPTPTPEPTPIPEPAWTQIADDAPWGRRAGLRVVELNGSLLLLGGRTPRNSTLPGDSDIFSDVWRSDDLGATWELALESGGDHWSPRAYFQAVLLGDEIIVLGGQDYGLMPNPFCELLEQGFEPPPSLGIDPDAPCPEFLPTSNFFNDVWASSDGITWEQRTVDAPWTPRAGLSAVALDGYVYVLGGSLNDDSALIGPNGPVRLYSNDVWRSADGAEWELMTDDAPWEPRAGASLVAWDDALWLFGGEDGFVCEPVETCIPPYFNDVWRSVDGATWELVSEAAAWSPRPGHQCEVLGPEVVCFGGFGLIENPDDVQVTTDGIGWELLDDPAWNAADHTAVKYDFESIAVETDFGPIVLTFGGDRETFDFSDPDNWLRVDSDVWRFVLPTD
ncbi:MAG: hypothetical protein AAF567_14940 [Actinomycetota bacterium]